MIGYTNDGDIVIPMADGSFETLAGTSVDVVIIKLNGDGEGLWAKRLGTVNKGEEIYGLVTDDACNVYVSGMVNNSTVPFINGKGGDRYPNYFVLLPSMTRPEFANG